MKIFYNFLLPVHTYTLMTNIFKAVVSENMKLFNNFGNLITPPQYQDILNKLAVEIKKRYA